MKPTSLFFHFCSGLTSIYVLPFALLFSLKTLAFLLNVNDGFLKLIIVGDRYHSGYNEEGIKHVETCFLVCLHIYLFCLCIKKDSEKGVTFKIFRLPSQPDTHSAQTELKHPLLVVYKSIVSH